MKVAKVRVVNFKGFRDSEDVHLANHINVVVGQNNSGKSAFLEAFRFSANSNKPHNSPDHREGGARNPLSRFAVEIEAAGKELETVALQRGGQVSLTCEGREPQDAKALFDKFFDAPNLRLSLECSGGADFSSTDNPPHRLFPPGGAMAVCTAKVALDRSGFNDHGRVRTTLDDTAALCSQLVRERVYVFNAERAKAARCAIEDTSTLRPDSANLPAVLLKLQKNPAAMGRYVELVRRVLPIVQAVSVSQTNDSLEIFVYAVATERGDLAVSLADSGTGVAQVLAILYVITTQPDGCILIDEPNSFLHPGAAKRLMGILREFPRHQYVVATHSPEVISALRPDRLIVIKWSGKESVVDQVDRPTIDSYQEVLWDIGASLSDVFGSDAIVWVEGPTEAACFPILVENSAHSTLGVIFAALPSASAFDSKRRNPSELAEIHRKLSAGNAFLPPGVAFTFDREKRSDQQIKELQVAFLGAAHFLPRRMYENYLLDSSAIAAILTEDQGVAVSGDAVALWMERNQSHEKILDTSAARKDPMRHCNASALLRRLFSEVSDCRCEYRKPQHSVRLTEWLLRNKPEQLAELITYVVSAVPARYKVNKAH